MSAINSVASGLVEHRFQLPRVTEVLPAWRADRVRHQRPQAERRPPHPGRVRSSVPSPDELNTRSTPITDVAPGKLL